MYKYIYTYVYIYIHKYISILLQLCARNLEGVRKTSSQILRDGLRIVEMQNIFDLVITSDYNPNVKDFISAKGGHVNGNWNCRYICKDLSKKYPKLRLHVVTIDYFFFPRLFYEQRVRDGFYTVFLAGLISYELLLVGGRVFLSNNSSTSDMVVKHWDILSKDYVITLERREKANPLVVVGQRLESSLAVFGVCDSNQLIKFLEIDGNRISNVFYIVLMRKLRNPEKKTVR
jgi:hypothetical protein